MCIRDRQNTLPWNQTVNGALDAMAHIMEYYFIGTNEETSIAVNEALLKTIIKSVEGLKVDAKDTISRANLAWAITLGLNGISGAGLKGGDWACHDTVSYTHLGLRGMAAYAYHAFLLGYKNKEVSDFFYQGLYAISQDWSMEKLLPVVMETGKANLKCMELLDKANTCLLYTSYHV